MVDIAHQSFSEANNLLIQLKDGLTLFFILPSQLNERYKKIIELSNKAACIYLENKLIIEAINSYRLKAIAEERSGLYQDYAKTMIIIGDLTDNDLSVIHYYNAYRKLKKGKDQKSIIGIYTKIIMCHQKIHNYEEIIDFSNEFLEKHSLEFDRINYVKEILADSYFKKQLYQESKNIMDKLLSDYQFFPLKMRLCNHLIFRTILCLLVIKNISDLKKVFFDYIKSYQTFCFSSYAKIIKIIIDSILEKNECKYSEILKQHHWCDECEEFTLLLIRYIYFY